MTTIPGLAELLEELDFSWMKETVTVKIHSGHSDHSDTYFIHFYTKTNIGEPYLRGTPIRNAAWEFDVQDKGLAEIVSHFQIRFEEIFRHQIANKYVSLKSGVELRSADTNTKFQTYTVRILSKEVDRANLISQIAGVMDEMSSKV